MNMSFVDQGGIGKVFPPRESNAESDLWSVETLRTALQRKKVWVASLPSNVECWHQKLLPYVEEGRFTFGAFVDAFANQTKFDFGKTLEALLNPPPLHAGGWYNSALSD